MVEIIPLVLNNQIKSISMKELVDKGYKHRYFNKKSILDYKEINNSDFETGDILYKIRALIFLDMNLLITNLMVKKFI